MIRRPAATRYPVPSGSAALSQRADGADADRFMAHVKKGLQEFDEAAL
jgi:hypothetical protein